MTIVPFEILDLQGEGVHILIDVEIYDQKHKMVIDTGASKTVLDKEQLSLVQNDLELQASEILSTGLGTNSMASFWVEIPELKIGDWRKKRIKTAVLDLGSINFAYRQMGLSPVIGVLGGDIFAAYGAVIDYTKNTIKLRSRKRKTQYGK